MSVDEAGSSSEWTREQDKAFENAVATYPKDSSDRWERMAADVPGKTLEEIKEHYKFLEDDINAIETGCVPLPPYNSSESSAGHAGDDGAGKKGTSQLGHYNSESNNGSKNSKSDQERRKGIAWTEDEHRLFLLGLDKYGKGDWRSISWNFVVTRTATQVASHAQKYFIRLNSMNKDRRRSSIHDITSVGNTYISSPQGPITGQSNGPAAGCSAGKPTKQPPVHSAAPSGIAVQSVPAIGQPIVGPLVSAVGTPVNLSAPARMAYGVRATLPGAMVPGAPVTYPMPHASAHR
ncbi:Transcription factor DIVARICATA [Hibiscus syriacus]|uniref:Transcription factor DIVARICATA n=1 Tax=Hibiscus syriacus TaxID=106335 RepID=A0A6A2ZX82_HIBSY|nr:transcription factor SRM1-like [Hibiscus syriacus]XP_039008953.1 transcription factor SRM1-like [Hibiscus syriacus]XP_039008954.1 transcription factor SRM1-like [Hibiscus syriacus]XP_039008955.1 transcription factor SRM1-like [Hibiscus syriacus]KAE8696604.1 Transcription factor DIVARICATA [Hibiscus syriacus]